MKEEKNNNKNKNTVPPDKALDKTCRFSVNPISSMQ